MDSCNWTPTWSCSSYIKKCTENQSKTIILFLIWFMSKHIIIRRMQPKYEACCSLKIIVTPHLVSNDNKPSTNTSMLLTCLVFWRLTTTNFPPFLTVNTGRLPLGWIWSELPRHTAKSACLQLRVMKINILVINHHHHFI